MTEKPEVGKSWRLTQTAVLMLALLAGGRIAEANTFLSSMTSDQLLMASRSADVNEPAGAYFAIAAVDPAQVWDASVTLTVDASVPHVISAPEPGGLELAFIGIACLAVGRFLQKLRGSKKGIDQI